jgi:hypothetical protein
MAYVSQDLKKSLSPKIKAICKKYGIKATLAVRNYSTLVLNISEGKIDFIKNYNETVGANSWYTRNGFTPATKELSVNTYHFRDQFSGKAKEALGQLVAAMNNGNWDKSDIQTDYFNVGWYIDVNIGKWNKPYQLVA